MVSETAQQLEASNPGPLANLAKEASMSNEPVSLDQVIVAQNEDKGPSQADMDTGTSISTRASEPLSNATHDITSSTSQTGEKNITANVGSEAQEKLTAIASEEVQAYGVGNEVFREGKDAVEG